VLHGGAQVPDASGDDVQVCLVGRTLDQTVVQTLQRRVVLSVRAQQRLISGHFSHIANPTQMRTTAESPGAGEIVIIR